MCVRVCVCALVLLSARVHMYCISLGVLGHVVITEDQSGDGHTLVRGEIMQTPVEVERRGKWTIHTLGCTCMHIHVHCTCVEYRDEEK